MTDVFGLDDDLDPLTRDRYGRPCLVPPGGGAKVAYTRASTLGNYVSDGSALNVWERRNLVLGLGRREDLWQLAGSLPALHDAVARKEDLTKDQKAQDRDTKKALDEIIEQAKESAYGAWKARLGTARHNACEPGADLFGMPESIVRDAEAFRSCLAEAGIEIIAHERFVVNDALMSAGSFDYLMRVPGLGICGGDLKTGGVAGNELKHAVQLAVYVNAALYDCETDERTPLESLTEGEAVNTETGLIIHLPAGSGAATIYALDLEVGLRAAKLATMVRTARSTKDIATPYAVLRSPLGATA